MKFTGERFVPEAELDSEIEIEHVQRYLSVRGLVKDKVVLDAASGSGYGTAILAKAASCVYGLEISHEAVNYAAQRYSSDNLGYLQGSVDNLPLKDGSVDVVVSFETIEHVTEEVQLKFLAEIKRILKKDGTLAISTPDKRIYSDHSGYKNEYHIKEFYRDEFYSILSSFFTEVKFFDQFTELSYALIGDDCKNLELINNERKDNSGKYIIALCSDTSICTDKFIQTIAIDSERMYQKKVDRVVELQEEIIEKNKVITHLEGVIAHQERSEHDLHATIEACNNSINEKNLIINKLEEEKKSLSHSLFEIQEAIHTERISTRELQQKLLQIYSTKSWKIIQKLYWLKSKIWPF